MASVGSLSVDLTANTASFNSNIEKAARNLNSQAANMNRSLANIQSRVDRTAKGFAALRDVFLTFQVGKFIGEQFKYAASLGETAQQLGVTTKQLQVYNAMAGQVGVSQEDMEKGLAKLTLSLGQAEAGAAKQGKAFAALGISLQGANGHVLTAGEALPKIADALAKVSDPAQRAAMEVALFGKAGQKLDNIMSQGSKAIDEYGKRLEETGQILSDVLINNADRAADRVEELNRQLKVSIAREVAANADAILTLANALAKLTFGALNFISTYPKLAGALTGAAIGARIAGAPGAVIGAGAGTFAGALGSRAAADSNMDVGFRAERLKAARETQRRLMTANPSTVFAIRRSESDGGDLKSATAEVRRQTDLTRQAMQLRRDSAKPATPAGIDLPDFLASGGGGGSKGSKGPKGPSAESLRNKAIRDAEAFANDLASLDRDLLSAKRDNLGDITLIADLDRQQLTVETEQLKQAIAADVATGKYTAAQGEQLTVKLNQVKAEKLLTIRTEELERQAGDLLNLAIAANDNQKDLLGAQEQLAVTQEERRKIQLKLLDLERQEEELKQRNIIALSKNPAERMAAQARLDAMPGIYNARGEGIRNQTAGPLEAYLKSTDPKLIQERSEALIVDELQSVRAGINDAISNALGIQNPMLKGLIDIFLEQVLIRPIAEALQKAQSGGGGGLLGGLLKVGGTLLGGALGGGSVGLSSGAMAGLASTSSMMASPMDSWGLGSSVSGWAGGGMVRGPGTGTSDSIDAKLSDGEFVFKASAVRRLGVASLTAMNNGTDARPRFASGGYVGKLPFNAPRNDNGIHVNVTVQGGGSERQNRETGAQVGNAAARQISNARRFGL